MSTMKTRLIVVVYFCFAGLPSLVFTSQGNQTNELSPLETSRQYSGDYYQQNPYNNYMRQPGYQFNKNAPGYYYPNNPNAGSFTRRWIGKLKNTFRRNDNYGNNFYNQPQSPVMDKIQGSYSTLSLSSLLGKMSSYEEGSCCGKDNVIIPGVALVASSLLLLYLVTSTATSGRRSIDSHSWNKDSSHPNSVYLDGPTWLSLIHELWEQDGVVEDPSCAQHTLCRMNNMAMSAPGQAGWAVSMSSLPLSYLLHRRHDGGFSLYMDAALMGRSGANCTLLYNACSRLH